MAEYSKVKIVLYSSVILLINDLTCEFPDFGASRVSLMEGEQVTSQSVE